MPKIISDLEMKILDTVDRAVAAAGWRDLDMRRIANDLGIGVGTLYNYYPNKAILITQAVVRQGEALLAALEALAAETSRPARERLREALSRHAAFTREHTGLWRDIVQIYDASMGETPPVPSPAQIKRVMDDYLAIFRRLLAEALPHRPDGERLSQLTVTLVFGVGAVTRYCPGDGRPMEEYLEYLLKRFLAIDWS